MNPQPPRAMLTWLAAVTILALAGHAQEQCRACHPREVAAFESSPMGRSIAKPAVDTSGLLYHKVSDSTISIRRHGPEMEHRVERHGIATSYPVAYSVGAGL